MPQPNPITALLVSEQAEDIRQISTILRAYYPGCRVEAVYTAEEGLEWASKQDWQFIVLDEHLSGRSSAELLPGLRSRAPHSGIFLLTSQSEARNAVQMMHAGADYCLFKHSPAFLTELPLATSMVLEKRNLRTQLDLASQRHHSLVEISSDLIYELDTQGRFRYVSPRASSLLGYSPQEMIGDHYSKIVYGSDLPLAEWRFNERRTGNRATNGVRVRLVGKQRPTGQTILDTCEVSATGLYSPEQHFLGTMGVVRTQPQIEGEKDALYKPSPEATPSPYGDRRTEPEPAKPPEVPAGPDPLATILKSTQHLLESLRELQQKARTPSTIVDKPTPRHPIPAIPTIPKIPVSLSPLIEEILSSRAEDLQTQDILVEAHLFRKLLPVAGQTAQLRQILEALIDKTKQLLRGQGKAKRLRVATRQVEPPGTPTAWTEVELTAEGSDTLKELPGKSTVSIVHLLPPRLAPLLEAFGGTLESDFLPAGGVRLRLRLPIWEPPPSLLQGPLQPGHTAPEREEAAPFLQLPPQIPLLHKKSQDLSSPERRRWPRVEIQAEASLAINGSFWKGTAKNINMGGLYLVFDSEIPPFENQPIRLSLITEGATLQIQSTIQGFRETVTVGHGSSANPARGFSITFGPLGEIEGKVLESLLQGLSERAVSVKIAASLIPHDTGALLLEVDTTEDETTQFTPVHPTLSETPEAEEVAWTERRLAARVKLGIPVQIETSDTSSPFLQCKAQIVNLSVNGAGVRMEGPVSLEGRQLLLRFTPPSALLKSKPEQNGFTRECRVVGEVAWLGSNGVDQTKVPEAFRSQRLGLRFLLTYDESRQRVADLVGSLLVSHIRVEETYEFSCITSDLQEIRDSKGHRIALYHDHLQDPLPPGSPVVIMPPGYGETKKEYIALSYYLAMNGFHVLRYDHTNHVGESEGSIENTSLTTMKEDLLDLLDHAEKTWPASSVTVIASSLAGRVAIKACAQDSRIKLLILLAGVIDVQATLYAIHQEDYFGIYRRGIRQGLVNMLGFNIDADHWLGDAIDQGFADLHSTLSDVKKITIPVIFFAPEKDHWVSMNSVKEVQVKLGSNLKHLYLIPEALHRLHENPRKARAVYSQLATYCVEHFFPFSPQREILEPAKQEIALQTRLERERARTQHLMAKSENLEFWRDYLAHFHHIVNSADYWHLMDLIYSLGGSLRGDEHILDAGCGNGNFGMFLMINQAYLKRNTNDVTPTLPHYVGIDFVSSALGQAKQNLVNIGDEIRLKLSAHLSMEPLIKASLSLADLNMPLPFRDNQFDRVVCNLVIGYLNDPLFTLRELIRVLCPHGKLILTNLKPYADLSQIYRNFVEIAKQPEELEEAKEILNNSGKIKYRESTGVFRFFAKQELVVMLSSSGAVRSRIYSTFANQAFIAVAEKPGTT